MDAAANDAEGYIIADLHFNDQDRAFQRTFDKHFELMLEAFRNGEAPPIHARAGRRALALAQAAIKSCETGRRVTLEDMA
ncbi:MAG: Gfo/Idh/MocA family oxidoreductase [Roseiflexaceae bacterium]